MLAIGLLFSAVVQCADGTPPPCRVANRPAAARPNSIAVLYFENNSPDTSDVYLADGLTDELITQLGRIQRLSIAPRSAVRRFRGSSDDQASIARSLAVNHVVAGSVRRAGTRLRVDVELVRLPAQQRVWGESYQRTDGDLFAIQEDIARAVTQAVAGTLLPEERRTLARAPTRDPLAYDLYLRGSQSLSDVSPAAVQRMRSMFEEALRRDPGFTGARGRLAFVYGWAINWSLPIDDLSPPEIIRRGRELVDQALREDSANSDAWLGRGFLLFFGDPPQYEQALASVRRAVMLDSTNAWARNNYATLLRRMGFMDEGVQQYHRALELTPGFAQSAADIGFVALQRRRFAEAKRWYDSALTLQPDAWTQLRYRARVNLSLGDTAAAREDSRRAMELAGPESFGVASRAGMLGQLGEIEEGNRLLEPMLRRFAAGTLSVRNGSELAMALAGLRRRDEAIAVLERTRPHGPWLWSYLIMPEFDALRGHPVFDRIVDASRPPNAPRLP